MHSVQMFILISALISLVSIGSSAYTGIYAAPLHDHLARSTAGPRDLDAGRSPTRQQRQRHSLTDSRQRLTDFAPGYLEGHEKIPIETRPRFCSRPPDWPIGVAGDR